MIELKPCPFCGGNAKFARIAGEGTEAVCLECHCGTPKYFSVSENPDTEKEMAAQVWNKRTSGWISVNGRVPCETSNKWCVGVNSCGKMFAFKESLACNPKSDTWLIPTALFNAEEITHFMYLPEPPEEVNKNG